MYQSLAKVSNHSNCSDTDTAMLSSDSLSNEIQSNGQRFVAAESSGILTSRHAGRVAATDFNRQCEHIRLRPAESRVLLGIPVTVTVALAVITVPASAAAHLQLRLESRVGVGKLC
ncbi:hypothetical protein RRG08_044813 [Elysia crispata]|uniref:Uncharacterized protein n=1 Tax=Elysia crispata TaxID=231223 RepID=A0AAE1DPZ9_9GAST|nr:hypothetical protein RRG08_044813 [Elysia crispata]